MALLPSDEDIAGRLTAEPSFEDFLASMAKVEEDSFLADTLKPQPPPRQPLGPVNPPRPLTKEERHALLPVERTYLEGFERQEDTPERVRTRLGLGIGSAGGALLKQAGGLARGLPTTGIDFIPGVRDFRKRLGTRMIEQGEEVEKKYEELGQMAGGGALSEFAQQGSTMAVANAPSLAVAPLGLPVAALTAGLQSFGGAYPDALKFYKGDEVKAQTVAVGSGLITALTTAGFGNTGIEALGKGLTGKTIAQYLKALLNPKNAIVQGGYEATEEMIDQAGQSIHQRLTYRPELTLEQAIKEVLLAGGAGFLMGGAMTAGRQGLNAVRDRLEGTRMMTEAENMDRVVEEATRTFIPTPESRPALPEKRNVAPMIDGWEIKQPIPGGFPAAIELTQRQGTTPGQSALSVYVPVNATPDQMREAIARKMAEARQAFEATRPDIFNDQPAAIIPPEPPAYQPGPLSQGQGAASLGVPLQRPGVVSAQPETLVARLQQEGLSLPIASELLAGRITPEDAAREMLRPFERQLNEDVTRPGGISHDDALQLAHTEAVARLNDILSQRPGRQSFAERVTPPGQRGRTLSGEPASYTVDITPPGKRGRQLRVAPPVPGPRGPGYQSLVDEANATRQRTLPPTRGVGTPTAHVMAAQLKTRMGESTVIGQPGFVPADPNVRPPEDRPRTTPSQVEEEAPETTHLTQKQIALAEQVAAGFLSGPRGNFEAYVAANATPEMLSWGGRLAHYDALINHARNIIAKAPPAPKPKGKMAARVKAVAPVQEQKAPVPAKAKPAPAPKPVAQPAAAPAPVAPVDPNLPPTPVEPYRLSNLGRFMVDAHGRRIAADQNGQWVFGDENGLPIDPGTPVPAPVRAATATMAPQPEPVTPAAQPTPEPATAETITLKRDPNFETEGSYTVLVNGNPVTSQGQVVKVFRDPDSGQWMGVVKGQGRVTSGNAPGFPFIGFSKAETIAALPKKLKDWGVEPAPATAKKPGKMAQRAAPKKADMGSLMERIAAKEAAAKAKPAAPAPAPTAAPKVIPRFDIGAQPEPVQTERTVTPASDRILARAGMSPAEIAATDAGSKKRKEAALGFANVNGKWQKVTNELYTNLEASIRTQNGKRLREVALVRDWQVKNNKTPDSVIHGVTQDDLFKTSGSRDATVRDFLTRADQQIKNANAYLEGIAAQRELARKSGIEGFIAGTKWERKADEVIAAKAAEFGKGLGKTNVGLVGLGLDPALLAAYSVKALAIAERGIRGAAEIGAELVNTFGESIKPHIDRILENMERLQGDNDAKTDAINLVQMEAASLLNAQIPVVQQTVNRIKEEISIRNKRGEKPVLTGEALNRQRAWDKVAANPFIKRHFIGPVERMMELLKATDGDLQTYYEFKSDPSSTPVETSGAAGLAINGLENFYTGYWKLRNEHETTLKRMQKNLEGAIEAHAESKGEVDTLNQLQEDFLGIAKEMMRQREHEGGMAAYRKALKNSAAIRNVLGFIAKNVDTSTLTQFTPTEVMEKINQAASAFVTAEKPLEEVVGATRDVIQSVAEYVAHSEPLRNKIAEGHDFLDEKVGDVPLSKFKNELGKLIKAGQFNNALRLFMTGVGDTATEKASTAKAARFFASQIRKTLIDIDALNETMNIANSLEQSPEFRQLSAHAYNDLGVREVMRTIDGTTLKLKSIFDEGDTVISFNTDRTASEENLKALKEYRDRAMVYLSDPQRDGYDPRRAAELQAFLDDADNLLDPAINPQVGKLVEGLPRRLFRTIFGLLGRIDMIPRFALDRTAGPASDLAHRTLTAYETVQEANVSILRTHHQRLRKGLHDALDSHDMGGDIEGYRDKVFAPIAASMQYFEGRPLRAGAAIGNGHTVTAEDINYFHEVRAFERAVMNAAGGVGERAFKLIQANPGGITYKRDGKTYVRMPHETGPGTVHRRLRGRMGRYLNEWNSARGAEGKIKVIDKNADRLLFGYINDVNNPKFSFSYQYGPQLRSIMRDAQSGNPVESFADLIDRIVDRIDENEGGDEEPHDQATVQANVLKEFDTLFKRFESDLPSDEHTAEKSIVKSFGGENSFNTERGRQIVPALWYDYGSVGLSERLGYTHNATVKFAIEHYRAVEALQRTLENLVQKFKDRNVDNATTKEERDKGEEFYGWNEARRHLSDVTRYQTKLKNALDYQVEVPDRGGALDPKSQAGTILSAVVSSLLSSVSANIMNTFGGGLNIVLFQRAINNQNLISALASEGGKGIKRMIRDTTHILARDPIYKALGDAKLAPLIGPIAEAMHNYLTETRELYRHSKEIGLNLNIDLLNTLQSEWRWRKSGGVESQQSQSKIMSNVIKPLETMMRQATEVLKQGTVGFVDSRINMTAVKMQEDMEQDLMNRAIEFGQLREERAKKEGRDPYDITDYRNRFSDKELVGGRLPSGAAIRLRDLLRRQGGVNVDAAMMRFYQKWKASKTEVREENGARVEVTKGLDDHTIPEGMKMFDQPTRNQIAQAISTDINQASFANRPIATKTGKAGANLGLFLGYPAFEMYKLAGLSDRITTKGATQGNVENIPMLIGHALAMSIIGSLGVGLSDEARRLFFNRQSPFPTIFNFNQTPKSYAKTLVSGAMSMFPLYGGMVNAVLQRAYKTGYDINSRFMVMNLATDAMRLLKEFYQSGQFLRPSTRFLQRWSFPMNYVGPHLPMMTGLTEVSQMRNSLTSSAHQIGLEARLKAPFSATDVTYTSSTGPLNDFMNAVGNGDLAGSQKAFQELVKVRQKEGDADPVMSAQRAIGARNPLVQIFGERPTEMEMQSLLSVMRDDDRARVQNVMRLFDTAVQATGARPVRYVQEQARSGGGGGGSAEGGGVVSYAGPPAGSFRTPAPSVRGTISGGSGGGSSTIGPARGFRIRTPRLRRRVGRLRNKVGRSRRRVGRIRSRMRRRRR